MPSGHSPTQSIYHMHFFFFLWNESLCKTETFAELELFPSLLRGHLKLFSLYLHPPPPPPSNGGSHLERIKCGNN